MRCAVIAGSPEANIDFIRNTVRTDDFVICADSGYNYAKEAGLVPDMVVGDFDSLGGIPSGVESVKLNVDKDDTDALHCCELAVQKGCDEIVILGGLGGRHDHSFANFCLLEYVFGKGVRCSLVSEKETVIYMGEGEKSFENMEGKTFSVFPFGCNRVKATYGGAKYPLENGYLESCFPMGVSNVFISNSAFIKIHRGSALIFIENNV